jgi:hydrogenase maturation factor
LGKLPTKELKKLLGYIKPDSTVIVPPQLGFDAGVHKLDNGKYLVVSTDPCIGVPQEWFGWLLIHYVASDIALFGAKTEYATINLLGSQSTPPAVFQEVMRQACEAADELGTTIVTGHTGTYQGISTVVGVCTGYGHINKDQLKTPAKAKPDDVLVCVKPLGLETVVNFALTHKTVADNLFGAKRTKELAKLVTMQSCVDEALTLANIEGVHAMHDATEGGVTSALNEVAEASKVGFVVDYNKLLIPIEVHKLAEVYGLSDTQVLSMSSTGTILAAVNPDAIDEVENVLTKKGLDVRVVGEFTKDQNRVLVKGKEKQRFPRVAKDPYSMLFSEKR